MTDSFRRFATKGCCIFSLILALFLPVISSAQEHVISGKVIDETNRQALAFVNVVVNDGKYGGMTDIDGKFSVTAPVTITKIIFSYVGYESLEMPVSRDCRRLNVALKPQQFQLDEVTVNAGKNPAHRIIDSVMAHRADNNPDNLGSYSYTIYDKMVFTIDSTDFGKVKSDTMPHPDQQKFASILDKNDLMVMESVSEISFMAPDRKQQNVVANKMSGVKEPSFIYLVSSMQSVSFYDEEISISDKRYVNPISRGSKEKYFFWLESVTAAKDGDSLYTVSFHPYKGTNFSALQGAMTISSDNWAIQSVKVAPAKAEGLYNVSIQQLYEKTGGQWFPKQLNTNLVFPTIAVTLDNELFPMAAIGKSYLSGIRINPPLDKKDFSEVAINVLPDAASRDEDFWNQHRIDSLSRRTRATYRYMDSVSRDVLSLDFMFNMMRKVMEDNSIPVGMFDIRLDKMLDYSYTRGYGLGLGLATNERFSKLMSITSYWKYWTRLKSADMGLGVNFAIDPQRQAEAGVFGEIGFDAIGAFDGFDEGGSLLSPSNYKHLYSNSIARSKGIQAMASSRMGEHFKVFLTLERKDMNYDEPIPVDDAITVGMKEASFTTAKVRLRFAYKEKFISDANGIRSIGTLYPVFWFSYLRSFKDVLGGDYAFNRYQFQVSKNFYTKYLGVSQVMFQAGFVDQTAPLTDAFCFASTWTHFGLYAPGSFCTMRRNEFFCDRFSALYLSHNFCGMLLKSDSQWFKPELTVATNIGWGTLRDAGVGARKEIKSVEKGYFESGMVIDGLLCMPLMKLGVGVFYRYGPYALEGIWKNFAWKWDVKFSL